MRETTEAKITEDINAINELLANYSTFVPSPTGGPQTAHEKLMSITESIKNSVNTLADVMVAEHPPGIKIK